MKVSRWRHNDTMPNLHVKQVPMELVERIKERVRLNGRSMNREIIACLEMVMMPREKTAEEKIAERKAQWAELGLKNLGPYDPEWKREGRA